MFNFSLSLAWLWWRNHRILIYPKEKKKKLESGTVEFMNESASAANHSHYSPQPPQNCCVIGRELFPMQRSSLSVPTHQRQCTTLRDGHLRAASLPSWEAGSYLYSLVTKGPGSEKTTDHRGPGWGTVKPLRSFPPLNLEVRKLKLRKVK